MVESQERNRENNIKVSKNWLIQKKSGTGQQKKQKTKGTSRKQILTWPTQNQPHW